MGWNNFLSTISILQANAYVFTILLLFKFDKKVCSINTLDTVKQAIKNPERYLKYIVQNHLIKTFVHI